MVNVNVIGDSITGSGKDFSFGVKYTPEKLAQLQALAADVNDAVDKTSQDAAIANFKAAAVESFSETVETACPYIHVNEATGKFYLKQDDKLSVHPMPKSFVDRILKSLDKGIDVMPLIKFWTRVLRNPNFSKQKAKLICNYVAKTYIDHELVQSLITEHGVSQDVAIERATSTQTPITKEGLLVTYKVSKEVFKKYALDEHGNKVLVDRYTPTKTIDEDTGEVTVDKNLPEYVEERVFEPAVVGSGHDAFYCGDKLGHQIKVGQVHYLPEWNQVNTNDNASCVKGLHVGNLDYIRGYQHSGTETHYTFVDPMHIGAVTDDGSGALRVKQYFTYDSFAGVTKTLYHSSAYAALVDEEWAKVRAEAIEATNKLKAEVVEDLDKQVEDMPA
jgi:hypothetical protein